MRNHSKLELIPHFLALSVSTSVLGANAYLTSNDLTLMINPFYDDVCQLNLTMKPMPVATVAVVSCSPVYGSVACLAVLVGIVDCVVDVEVTVVALG